MVNKNKYKRQYHANKVTGIAKLKKGKYYTATEMRVKLFGEIKTDDEFIAKKLELVSNNDLGEKMDTISSELGKYIKHSKKWRVIQIVFGIGLGLTSLGLFVYGKIQIDTFFDLLKLMASSFGLA